MRCAAAGLGTTRMPPVSGALARNLLWLLCCIRRPQNPAGASPVSMVLAGAKCFYTPFAVFFAEGYTVEADGESKGTSTTKSLGSKTRPQLQPFPHRWKRFGRLLFSRDWGLGRFHVGG